MTREAGFFILDTFSENSRKWTELLRVAKEYVKKSKRAPHNSNINFSDLTIKDISSEGQPGEKIIEFTGLSSDYSVVIKLESDEEGFSGLILDAFGFFDEKKRNELNVEAYTKSVKVDAKSRMYKEILRELEVAMAKFLFGDDDASLFLEEGKNITKRTFIENLIELDVRDGNTERLKRFYQAEKNFLELINSELESVKKDESSRSNAEIKRFKNKLSRWLVAAIIAAGLAYFAITFWPATLTGLAAVAASVGSVVAAIGVIWVVVYGLFGLFAIIKNFMKRFFKSFTYRYGKTTELKNSIEEVKNSLDKEMEQVAQIIDGLLKAESNVLELRNSNAGLAFKVIGFMVLGQYLKLGKLSKIEIIDLTDCNVHEDGINTFIEALKVQNEESKINLKEIKLCGNDVGVKVVEGLIESLKENITVTHIEFDNQFNTRDSKGEVIVDSVENVSDSSKKNLTRQLMINRYLRDGDFKSIKDSFVGYSESYANEASLELAALEKIYNNFDITYIAYDVVGSLKEKVNKLLEQNNLMQEVVSKDRGEQERENKIREILAIDAERAKKFFNDRGITFSSEQPQESENSFSYISDAVKRRKELEDILDAEVDESGVNNFFEFCKQNDLSKTVIRDVDLSIIRKYVRFDVYDKNEGAIVKCDRLKELPEENRFALLKVLFNGEGGSEEKARIVSNMIETEVGDGISKGISDIIYFSFFPGVVIGGSRESYYNSYDSLKNALEKTLGNNGMQRLDREVCSAAIVRAPASDPSTKSNDGPQDEPVSVEAAGDELKDTDAAEASQSCHPRA